MRSLYRNAILIFAHPSTILIPFIADLSAFPRIQCSSSFVFPLTTLSSLAKKKREKRIYRLYLIRKQRNRTAINIVGFEVGTKFEEFFLFRYATPAAAPSRNNFPLPRASVKFVQPSLGVTLGVNVDEAD